MIIIIYLLDIIYMYSTGPHVLASDTGCTLYNTKISVQSLKAFNSSQNRHNYYLRVWQYIPCSYVMGVAPPTQNWYNTVSKIKVNL